MPPSSASNAFEVAIIGGGPAGSVAAAWLAQRGRRVVQFERAIFPRFHIGESLLPNGNGVLRKIGAWDKIAAAGFVEKRGAEFTIPDRSRRILNIFAQGIVPGMGQTYQEERARFDDILFQHAQSCGSDSRQGISIVDTRREGAGWELTAETVATKQRETFRARWIIDASGRNCLMGRTLKIPREELPYPGRMAVFNHFRGFKRSEGERGGDIIVLRLQDAWFWCIPISAEVTSIGVVAHKGAGQRSGESREAFFWRKVGESSWLKGALADAAPIAENYHIESDYSFSYKIFGAANTLFAGDAASFIDPVFSSGVYLALESGLLSAELIDQRLTRNRDGDDQLYERYTRRMKRRVRVMRNLIDAYYDNGAFDVFMTPKPPISIDRAVNSILAGCLEPPFAVRWRIRLFKLVCRLHKRFGLVPKFEWPS